MGHAIDLRVRNRAALKRMADNHYSYIFLQHGVSYMLSLASSYRSAFHKEKKFPLNGKVVVSSLEEAKHFMEYGGFLMEDLLITGMPKFDRARRDIDHEKIVIMPTWRPWDYNLTRINPEKTTYFTFVKRIIDQIPHNYLDKIVFIPHPLLNTNSRKHALSGYIPDSFSYDEILKKETILITDYSSISYDAFYRGINVIFCWAEKKECLQRYNNTLMLNDENAFGDICYAYQEIATLVEKNYNPVQEEKYREKYKKIVSFSDNQNTKRLIEELRRSGYIQKDT